MKAEDLEFDTLEKSSFLFNDMKVVLTVYLLETASGFWIAQIWITLGKLCFFSQSTGSIPVE